MGRIRTIKPEFPQSESIGRVSRDARLCYIMLWTLADDAGRLRGNPRMLASLLFPYDDDAKKLIDKWLVELDQENCIKRYSVDGNNYIQINEWLTHQKIDKPSPSKIPSYKTEEKEDSRGFASDREGYAADQGRDQGREGILEPNGSCPTQASDESPPIDEIKAYEVPDCPYDAILAVYHLTLPNLSKVEVMNDFRRGMLRQRWREVCSESKFDKEQGVDWFRDYFTLVKQSEWLTGRSKPRPGEVPFQADFEWLVRPQNFVKVIEGRYNRKAA